jgi:hypothetical protein
MSITAMPEVAECPCCRTPASLGPKRIHGQFWFARCSKCGCSQREPLPTITKKIIYLDQCFLSNVLSGKEPRWKVACDRLKLLIWLDAVICPFSQIHKDESLLARHSRDNLKALYRELAGQTIEFLPPDEIEEDQLLDAMRSFLSQTGVPNGWQMPRLWEQFCKKNPHVWLNGIAVRAEFPANPATVKWLEDRKARLHSALEGVAGDWQTENKRRFAEDVQREARGYGRALIAEYRRLRDGLQAIGQMLARIPNGLPEQYRAMTCDGVFDPTTPPGTNPGVVLVHLLAAEVHKARPCEADPVSVVEKFFDSEMAMTVPFQYITAHLWAAIAHQIRTSNRHLLPSDSYDIDALAYYAPYCDAMFLDNSFRSLAEQKDVGIPGRYGVRLFSATTMDDFSNYLDELLHNLPLDHCEALKLVHPEMADTRLLNPGSARSSNG